MALGLGGDRHATAANPDAATPPFGYPSDDFGAAPLSDPPTTDAPDHFDNGPLPGDELAGEGTPVADESGYRYECSESKEAEYEEPGEFAQYSEPYYAKYGYRAADYATPYATQYAAPSHDNDEPATDCHVPDQGPTDIATDEASTASDDPSVEWVDVNTESEEAGVEPQQNDADSETSDPDNSPEKGSLDADSPDVSAVEESTTEETATDNVPDAQSMTEESSGEQPASEPASVEEAAGCREIEERPCEETPRESADDHPWEVFAYEYASTAAGLKGGWELLRWGSSELLRILETVREESSDEGPAALDNLVQQDADGEPFTPVGDELDVGPTTSQGKSLLDALTGLLLGSLRSIGETAWSTSVSLSETDWIRLIYASVEGKTANQGGVDRF